MIWEFRAYDVAHGRLGEEVERMRRVAIDPSGAAGEASMFDEYGVSRPFCAWTGIAGRGLQKFGYLMQWQSLAARQASFPRFWADRRWIDIKETTDDGRPMVEHIDCWLVQPAADHPAPRAGSGRPHAVQELRWVKLANGDLPAARLALTRTTIEPLADVGGDLLSVFDLVVGPQMASCLVFFEWTSLDACQEGNARAAAGRSDLATAISTTVVKPVDFAGRPEA